MTVKKELLEKNNMITFIFEIQGLGVFSVISFYHSKGIGSVIVLPQNSIRSSEDLELPRSPIEWTAMKRGIIIVGSSLRKDKMEVLRAMINEINGSRFGHIIIISSSTGLEIESKKCLVTSMDSSDETKHHQNLKFASSIESEVVVIDEIRDSITAEYAVSIASSGRLVLSTGNSPSTIESVQKIIEQIITDEKTTTQVSFCDLLIGAVGISSVQGRRGNTVLAYEIYRNAEEFRDLLKNRKYSSLYEAMERDKAYGMKTMDQSLLQLALKGTITKEEGIRNAMNPKFITNSNIDRKSFRFFLQKIRFIILPGQQPPTKTSIR